MAGYRSRSKPFARITQRSSATTSGAAELIALGWKESNVRASRLSEIDQFNIEELDWVELGFKNIRGKMDFRAAFDALNDPRGSLHEAETIADQVKASAPRPRPRRGLVGSPTIHPDRRADIIRSITASPESKFRPQQGLVGSPTIHPDRRADIIRSITASPESKFRPQQGLVGSPTIHPDRRADIMPSVTASLDSKVRLQQDLAGDSTNHPDEKAGMVPLVAGSSYFDSKFHGRSRSSDVLDADQQTSSKSSYESSVGEIKTLRSRIMDQIMENTGVKRRTPRIYSSPYAAHIANKKSNQVSWLLDEPPQFETSAKAEQMQRQRRICRKLVLFKLWKWELNDGVPKEMWSSPASFEFINVSEISRFDKVKNLFETYSGREWDWWPLDPPAKPLEGGKVRIRWQCVSELSPDIPCASADGLRPVAINAGPIHRHTLPRSAKPSSMRIQQPGTKVAMPHLSQWAPPLVTHTLGASSQGRSPATPRNQPELPLIYVPPHKLGISRKPIKAPIQKICTFYSASTKEARSTTLKSSPPNARTTKPSLKISDKITAASGASFASGCHHCNSPIAIS